ncbi:isopeptide-forming domain-containing fimbrial protein [Lysobacter tyrosinilyticus]
METNANDGTKAGRGRARHLLRSFALWACTAFAFFFTGTAFAQQCVASNVNPNALVQVLSNGNNSYCELCGYGYVTVRLSNPFITGSQNNVPFEQRTINVGNNTIDQWRVNPTYGTSNPDINYSSNSVVITLPNNGLVYYAGANVTVGGANWTNFVVNAAGNQITIRNLGALANGSRGNPSTRDIRIPIHRAPTNTPESLYNANPTAQAQINISSMADSCSIANSRELPNNDTNWHNGFPPGTTAFNPALNHTGSIDVRQPNLQIYKQGWNYDAGQREATRSDTVYGHNDDDIVWRLNIANQGDAPLQDLRIDDVISRADVMNAHYVCPTQVAADAIAAADGVLPAGSVCVTTMALTGNVLADWAVPAPFGLNGDIPAPYANTVNAVTPGTSVDAVDIAAGANINLYVVGKVQRNASCSSGTPMTNQMRDIQFGCAVQTPPGGLLQSANLTDNATLKTYYGQGGSNAPAQAALQVTRTLTGIDGSATVGMRGLVTVVLSNQSGGTVWFDPAMGYHLKDALPAGYVIDPGYAPRLIDPANVGNRSFYGAYPGRIDTLTWSNRNGAIPANTGDSTSYLANGAPEFKLSSTTNYNDRNPDSAYGGAPDGNGHVYANLMRHGDVLVIRFAIVLKDPKDFDRAADLDVQTEDPGTPLYQRPEPTDPDQSGLLGLHNTVDLRFKTLCAGQGTQSYTLVDNGTSTGSHTGGAITFDPEDLDISVDQPTFIVTNDRTQTTPLSVTLRNNGGVNARDFSALVSFGPTLNVTSVTAPANWACDVVPLSGAVPQPAPYKAWVVNPPPDAPNVPHLPLPANGTVYRCYPNHVNAFNRVLAPNASVQFAFQVNKTSDAARILADDVTFRADVVGEIWTVSGMTTPLLDIDKADSGGNLDDLTVSLRNTAALHNVSQIDNHAPMWFPAPGSTNAGYYNKRSDGEVDRGNLYSLDAHWSRGIGFNLMKDQVTWSVTGGDTSTLMGAVPALGACNENVTDTTRVPALPDSAMSDGMPNFARKQRERVQIGEECSNRIQAGGWFGFKSRGFRFIGVRDVQMQDEVQDGLVYVASTAPQVGSQIAGATQAPNDPAKSALQELLFGWRFTGNRPDSVSNTGNDYIVDIDQWFHINAVTRLQNKAVNQRALPDLHGEDRNNALNSIFKAVYYNDNANRPETYAFGSGQVGMLLPTPALVTGKTVGYPWERIRRSDVVVTEPRVQIAKHVCQDNNFSAGANGGTCAGGWQTAIANADTTHNYVFRLMACNGDIGNINAGSPTCAVNNDAGQPRAPAYDAVVEDTLDASDLMVVTEMASDGLDNDGDGQIDEADEANAQNIGDNAPMNGVPGVITFSHLRGVDGAGLRRINNGSSAWLYYVVDLDDRLAPNQTIGNGVELDRYDSLAGSADDDGQQMTAQRGSGDIAGARVYGFNTTNGDPNLTDRVSLTLIQPQTRPKEIIALSQSQRLPAGTQPVVIGEEITYRLTASLPVTRLRGLTITDNLPSGLSCADAPVVDLSSGVYAAAGFKRPDLSPVPPVTPTCSGTMVMWSFGDVVLTRADNGQNTFTFPLQFVARVDNTQPNQDGVTLYNGGTRNGGTILRWQDAGGAEQTRTYGEVAVRVSEPQPFTATKVLSNVTPGKAANAPLAAGDIAQYVVTLRNGGSSTAYDLNIVDTPAAELRLSSGVAPTATIGGAPVAGFVATPAGAPNGPLVWGRGNNDGSLDLPAGATLVLRYRMQVATAPAAGTSIINTIVADWTSLDGASIHERTGADAPNAAALNNYFIEAREVGNPDPSPTVALAKAITQPTAAIGEAFAYRITVPAAPSTRPLYDVRISDNLASATGVVLEFVSVRKVSGGGSWTPVNTGSGQNLVIEDTTSGGIDIPAGQQAVIEVRVRLANDPANAVGDTFTNTAGYEFDHVDNDRSVAGVGVPATSPQMTVVAPQLVMDKSGPASLQIGQTGTFVLDAVNTTAGNTAATAWNARIIDRLPDTADGGGAGGMCATAPTITSVQLFAADGTTLVATLAAGSGYSANFAAAGAGTSCTLTVDTTAGIGPGQHLRVTYQAAVDVDTPQNATLTNVAGANRWLSTNPAGAGNMPLAYDNVLTDGTPSVADFQDAHTLQARNPMLRFEKTVANLSRGENPATLAMPGDRLRYTLRVENLGSAAVSSFDIRDELDALNAAQAAFVPGSLVVVAVPAGASNNSNANGGARGTGLLDVRGIALGGQGSAVQVVFDVQLAANLANGSKVANQATLLVNASALALSDDPNVNGQADPAVAGDEDPTVVPIAVAPDPASKILLSPTNGEATIGQDVVYRITLPGAVRNTPMHDVRLTDVLDANLEYLGATITGGTGVSNNSTANQLDIAIDQIPPDTQVVVELHARVRNIFGAQQGMDVANTARFTYSETDGGKQEDPLDTNTVKFHLVEPGLSIAKSASAATASAGQVIRYTVTLTAASGADASGAFDIDVVDTLPAGLTYAGNATLDGNPLAAPAINGNVLTWTNLGDIAEGASVVLAYDTRVAGNALPDQVMTNSAIARWTGLDGSNINERTGVDGVGGLNDYVTAPTVVSVATPGSPPHKVLTAPASGLATIGEDVVYTLTVPGAPSSSTLYDVQVLDPLDANLEYVSATVTGVAGVTNSSTAAQMNLAIAQIPAGQQAVIELHTRVRNIDSANAGVVVGNIAAYSYAINAGGQRVAPLQSEAVNFTIVEPVATVAKTGDKTAVTGGDIVRYTVNLAAANAAENSDAFDFKLVDTLAPGLEYVGNPTVSGSGNTIAAPAISGDGSAANPYVLTWSLAGGSDIDVAKGETVAIAYDVRVRNGAPALQSLPNRVTAEWTGLDGDSTYERHGNGCPSITAPNDYCAGPASFVVVTDPPKLSFAKTVTSTTPAHPGEFASYRLEIANVSTVGVSAFELIDEIDALNNTAAFVPGTLQIVGALPAGAVDNSNASGGTKGTGLLDIRNLTLGAAGSGNETLAIDYRVQLVPVIANGSVVLNQARAQSGSTLLALSDDPSVNGVASPDVAGDEDPTRLPIESAPQLVIEKTSTYLGANPALLMAGDRMRYTITVRNTGTDHARNVILRDLVPANTSYVAGSTTLNGAALADAANGLPLQNGIAVTSPVETVAGVVRVDSPADAAANVATLGFEVVVSPTAADGTVIANQAFVMADTLTAEAPSDDPRTPVVNDPTRDVVGNAPLLYAEKAVVLQVDTNSNGAVDPGDTLRYTLRIHNTGAVPATGVVLQDEVPPHTTYVAASTRLNGALVNDAAGGSPLVPGVAIGDIARGAVATVQFNVTVDAGTPNGTLIENQANVRSVELPDLLTDGDGNPSTGPEPTVVVVGPAQALAISKQVAVVGGGAALPGAEVEYLINVRNVSTVAATQVRIVDDLPPQLAYVAGSATLNGSAAGVTVTGNNIVADYTAVNGPLAPGATATVRLRARIANGLAIGTRVTNTATVNWNDPVQVASASVGFDVGGMPGVGTLSGRVWHDADFDKSADPAERLLQGWSVELLRNGRTERTVTTDAGGNWQMGGVSPNVAGTAVAGDLLELRFTAPGAVATTAKLGFADSSFTNELQRIRAMVVQPGAVLASLNLPIEPNGVIYESMNRGAIPGARLRMLDASGAALPASCFADPVQQGQVTLQSGYYRFDLNFADPACPAGGAYLVQVAPPSANFIAGASALIPPTSDASTAAFSVPGCPASVSDAVPGTTQRCEAQPSEFAPSTSVAARSAGTTYYLHLRMDDTFVPGSSQIFNNHIPLDLDLNGALAISKTTPKKNVVRGELVPYTITLRNISGLQLRDVRAVDTYPAGFRYVPGSARVDNVAIEPTQNGRELTWSGVAFGTSDQHAITLLLAVGAGVGEGEFVNHARVWNGLTDRPLSGDATATVRVTPDPTFDCTDVIGKVYDDANRNGHQDQGEGGLGGVRLVTARGLAATTDKFGRYHITCAVVPNEDRGSNFVLKLDDRTLPSGYRPSTRETVIARATRGKALSIDFGASVFRVVSLDLSDEVFEHDGTQLRDPWQPRLQTLIDELAKERSVLRLSYLADLEDPDLVEARLAAIKAKVIEAWPDAGADYPLTVEQQTFWRRGAPVQRPAGNQGARK